MSDKKDLQAEMLKDVAYLLRDMGKGVAKELIIYYAGGKLIQMIFRGVAGFIWKQVSDIK